MKKLFVVIFLFLLSKVFSQSVSDPAVQITAAVQTSPAQITLSWPTNAATTQYQVFRKLKTAISWGAPLSTLSGTVTQFIDNTVSAGVNYEYRIIRVATGYTGYGYINSGINVPETDYRGKLILVVDSSFVPALEPEIKRLVSDIQGDGWDVVRLNVKRNDSVTWVKARIVNEYAKDTLTKAVFLLGHVPVPYSGNINPDGHPDHLGAWPADGYYADMDGVWTDAGVSSTTVSPSRTQNAPGDGKFDQSLYPTSLELQVGRADMAGLSTFTVTEQQLLKNYLDKDHNYRKKVFTAQKRAVIDDNFGYFSGEAFAASGYKNFAPLVGTNSVTAADYFTSMTGNSYLWSYGCGGGSYTSASGIGNTSNFASSSLQGVFTMLFGSYFGDWDAPNSFLKAPLAQGNILTCVWSGRPHYQFHHMGLGENIGYGVLLTQNNPAGLYFASPTGITGQWVHNGLMGDPTLRNDVLAPVSNVVATKAGNDCHISWTASPEQNLAGYNIYVKNDSLKSYTKLNNSPITATTYTDYCLQVKSIYSYMVRALKLETTSSGSYYNMSEGISDTAYNATNFVSATAFNYTLNGTTLQVQSTAQVPVTLAWDFGNGSTSTSSMASTAYTANGIYVVSLIATSACLTDTAYLSINITETALRQNKMPHSVSAFPNPTKALFTLNIPASEEATVVVFDAIGKEVFTTEHFYKDQRIDLSGLNKGLYFIKAAFGGKEFQTRIMKE